MACETKCPQIGYTWPSRTTIYGKAEEKNDVRRPGIRRNIAAAAKFRVHHPGGELCGLTSCSS